MSPTGNRRYLGRTGIVILVWTIGAAGGVAVFGGRGSENPPVPPKKQMPVDLLATRDLDTSTPCGLPAGGTDDARPLIADQIWTRTGGKSCYQISATAAQCFDATEVPYTVDATGLGWVVEPDAINRIKYSTAIDCTNWSCSGTSTATPLQTAPDGSATATLLTMPNGTIINSSTTANYTDGATLHPRVWVKCSSGTLSLLNSLPGNGWWSINCTTIAGAWTLINASSQAAVTETNPWVGRTGGVDSWQFYVNAGAVTATVWAPTLTEEPGTGLVVIPTAASAVSTGDPSWLINNADHRYYRPGDTITASLTQISGLCLRSTTTDATDVYMTGLPGAECAGIWYSLQVTR
jgi:hypothetical protein